MGSLGKIVAMETVTCEVLWAGQERLTTTPIMASTESRENKAVLLLKAAKGDDDPYAAVSLTKV